MTTSPQETSPATADEQQQIAQFEEHLAQMQRSFEAASQVQSNPKHQRHLDAMVRDQRLAFYGNLESPHVGDELHWFDAELGRVRESEWNKRAKGVEEAVVQLRSAILMRLGMVRRGGDAAAMEAATQEVVARMQAVGTQADKVAFGGDIYGDYGHILFHLMEDVARNVLGVKRGETSSHPGVRPSFDALFRHTTEEGLR